MLTRRAPRRQIDWDSHVRVGSEWCLWRDRHLNGVKPDVAASGGPPEDAYPRGGMEYPLDGDVGFTSGRVTQEHRVG